MILIRPFLLKLFTFLILGIPVSLFAQSDSLSVTDSLKTEIPKQKSTQLEGPIKYSAADIYSDVINRKTILVGDASVKYMKTSLKAEKIVFDWTSNTVRAEGTIDTVWQVTPEGDSVQVPVPKGLPEFKEAGDIMRGDVMVYNLKTRKAHVVRGRTQFEDGYYVGEAIKMVEKNTMNIGNATYSTCDKDENPHFHFWFKQMKIVVNDKLIAKPVVLYLGKIPMMALPFAYFPIRKGRHSGFLIPKYGYSDQSGRYLRGLGYYWAVSDYWDIKSSIDYFEKSGFLMRGDLRYNVRYKLRGSISGSVTRKDFEASGNAQRRWDLRVTHNQDISPTMKLTASGYLTSSGNFLKEFSSNREQRMRQQITSNATLTKRFEGSKSITMNLSQTRKLDTDEITEILPRIQIRLGQSPLIPKPKPDRLGNVETKWYHNIYVNYSSQILNESERTRRIVSDDTSWYEDRDTGWDHAMSISSPQKLFGVLTFNPSMSYKETWYSQREAYYLDENNEVQSREEDGFFSRRTFQTSAGFSTKLYGMFQPKLLKDVLLRHVVTPNVSFNFSPDFSDPSYGYYQTIEDTLGNEYEYDRYANNLFSGTPSYESQSMNFSVNNLFQMKTGEGEEVRKFDLFTLNLSSNYNWKKETQKLGDISSSLRANPLKSLSMNLGATHSLYKTDEDGSTTNTLYVDDYDSEDPLSFFRMRFARLKSFRANMTFRFSGRARSDRKSESEESVEEGEIQEDHALTNLDPVSGDRFEMNDQVSGFDIPWKLNGSLNYSESRSNPLNINKTFYLRSNLEFNLTPNWKVSYSAQYDFMEKKPVSQDFIFYRDLHCWEARFVWTPSGYNKRFYFKINIKSPTLKDIKYEQGRGGRGLAGF